MASGEEEQMALELFGEPTPPEHLAGLEGAIAA